MIPFTQEEIKAQKMFKDETGSNNFGIHFANPLVRVYCCQESDNFILAKTIDGSMEFTPR